MYDLLCSSYTQIFIQIRNFQIFLLSYHLTFDINCASNLIITYFKSKRLKGKSPQEWTRAFKDAKQWAQEVSRVN